MPLNKLAHEMIDLPEDITITAVYGEGDVNETAEKDVSIFSICPSGSALEFDGVDDYVDVGDRDSLDFGSGDSFTLSVWFITDGDDIDLICKRIVDSRGYHLEGYHLKIWQNSLHFSIEDTINNGKNIQGTTVVNDNQWHHVTAVRDTSSDKLYLYLDGIEDAVPVIDTTIGTLASNQSFEIGHHPYYDCYFDGTIDEVAVYNRALSAQEIQANMHRRPGASEPNLVSYWDFDEGQGQVAHDVSGNGNNGFLGSDPCDIDNSDPEWIVSDAPVGICSYVAVDIKPGSCPNPLNLKSKGILSATILGTENFDVMDIDPASIFLEGAPAIRSSLEDMASPISGGSDCECTTEGPDGYTDLTVKFETQQVVSGLISSQTELVEGQMLVLSLSGELSDGTAIQGTDCVVLVGNVSRWLEAMGSDSNDDGIINFLDLAELANYWLESQ